MFKKGYTVFVSSWENDADNPSTTQIHFDTLNEVKFTLELLDKIGRSINNGDNGVGNSMDGELDLTPYLIRANVIADKYSIPHIESTDHLADILGDYTGYSEYYDFRVYESATVYYFDEDVPQVKMSE